MVAKPVATTDTSPFSDTRRILDEPGTTGNVPRLPT
jgi:hypothetical protein